MIGRAIYSFIGLFPAKWWNLHNGCLTALSRCNLKWNGGRETYK